MTDREREHEPAPQPGDDAVTTGAVAGTGTGGLGSAGGTDTTPDVGSVPRDADRPDPIETPFGIEAGDEDDSDGEGDDSE